MRRAATSKRRADCGPQNVRLSAPAFRAPLPLEGGATVLEVKRVGMSNGSLTAHQEDGTPSSLRLRSVAPSGRGDRAAAPRGWLGMGGLPPGLAVAQDGIEDGEELPSDRDERHHLGF